MLCYEMFYFFLRSKSDFLNVHIMKIIHHNENYQAIFNLVKNIPLMIVLDCNIENIIVFFTLASYSNISNSFTKLIPDFL